MNIVLFEPEIALNTGNIGRTCVATGTTLHMIEPFGFSINEKQIKRAGMDYWERLDLRTYDEWADFVSEHGTEKLFLATTKTDRSYTDVKFDPDSFIMFGPESRGIPEEILNAHPENCIRIPMLSEERCLNLANSVCVVLYEALRQNGFKGLV
ncbi:MAG: tRNA (cytidine(34)-2'-O)-methyltransferase [Lachnospiraceae bacterium]|nr:tRNA (cytidine(34)-2'-O)-methyltransferase [Lachnospiraceae bacterium]